MKLETKRFILRDVKESDSESLIKNINNLRVSRYLAHVPHPYTKKDAKWWINKNLKSQKKKQREKYSFVIELKSVKGVIGGIGLESVDYYNKTATLGYWLGEKYWRNKIMSEAVEEILKFAFNKLKLRRINISAYTKNKASNALIKKIGFRYEGTKIKAVKVKSTGKIYDENIYGLLKENWRKTK